MVIEEKIESQELDLFKRCENVGSGSKGSDDSCAGKSASLHSGSGIFRKESLSKFCKLISPLQATSYSSPLDSGKTTTELSGVILGVMSPISWLPFTSEMKVLSITGEFNH